MITMGNTQCLIHEVVKLLQMGQPLTVVVGASTEHCRYLQHELCCVLDNEGECYAITRAKSRVMVGESLVDFQSIHNIDIWRCGHRGYGEAWHDYAIWCYERYLDKTDAECTGN